jgi:hypothetical protein
MAEVVGSDDNEGLLDGCIVGTCEGDSDGIPVGPDDGCCDNVGMSEGAKDVVGSKLVEGDDDSVTVGCGLIVGPPYEGVEEGNVLGSSDGSVDGISLGLRDGEAEGLSEGEAEGKGVGSGTNRYRQSEKFSQASRSPLKSAQSLVTSITQRACSSVPKRPP